jgi:hypothetical protein
MKRNLVRTLSTATLLFFLHLQASAQTSGQMVFSKDASGPITQVSLSLSLRSNSSCDETESLIPNQSRLISDSFSMIVGPGGVGTFQGAAKIITPEGKLIVEGFLQGTVGLSAKRSPGKHCRIPGHLEGMLTAIPGSSGDRSSKLVVNFSADEIAEAASPVPVYRAHLNGFITIPPPQADKIRITQDLKEYDLNDPITAIITNESDSSIQVLDEQSYCTIVQLQLQEGNNWILEAACPLNRAPIIVTIGSGETKKISLPSDPNAPNNKRPGIYRLALTFTVIDKNGKPIGNPVTNTSPSFRVGTPVSGGVTITTDRSSYDINNRIIATISNNTDQNIQAEDHRSYCTILFLQKNVGNSWNTVATCLLKSATRLVKIDARQSVSISLPPDPATPQNEPGMYRLELLFMFLDNNDQPVGPQIILDSPPFTVTATVSSIRPEPRHLNTPKELERTGSTAIFSSGRSPKRPAAILETVCRAITTRYSLPMEVPRRPRADEHSPALGDTCCA